MNFVHVCLPERTKADCNKGYTKGTLNEIKTQAIRQGRKILPPSPPFDGHLLSICCVTLFNLFQSALWTWQLWT